MCEVSMIMGRATVVAFWSGMVMPMLDFHISKKISHPTRNSLRKLKLCPSRFCGR